MSRNNRCVFFAFPLISASVLAVLASIQTGNMRRGCDD